jgi:hypothetical protein
MKFEVFNDLIKAINHEEGNRISIYKALSKVDIRINFDGSPSSRFILEALKKQYPADTDIMEWWCYESNFGADIKPDSMTEVDGTPIDVSTPRLLWEYLESTRKENDNG